MSNEIKNTLFRFVSMRAPELSTDVENNLGFITQPNVANGQFNSAIATLPTGMTKAQRLLETANSFNDEKTLIQVKQLNSGLYTFSVWFSKNKNKASISEISDKLTGVNDLSDSHLTTLWQNLYFQVVLQKDFYVKELIIQLLIANHIVQNKSSLTKQLLKCKVVLPRLLFVDEEVSTSSPLYMKNSSSQSYNHRLSSRLNKIEQSFQLNETNNELKKLHHELKKAQKVYHLSYQEEYEKKYEEYQLSIKPLLDRYNQDVKAANRQWCSTKDPNTPYDINHPCHQPEMIPYPELPKFTFTFHSEMDEEFLTKNLSKESLLVLSNLKQSDTSNQFNRLTPALSQISHDFDSFENSFNTIGQYVDSNTSTIADLSPGGGFSSVVVGDLIFDLPQNPDSLEPFEYSIKAGPKSNNDSTLVLFLTFGIPDASWNASSMSYRITRDDTSFEVGSNILSTKVQLEVSFKGISLLGITSNIKEFYATILFDNNQVRILKIENFELNKTHNGFLTEENQNSDGDSEETNSTFIPSGFGVRQLGIADYNKVEQSIQGYIEGEVAHIENIMAREFREKSTRSLVKSEVTETTSTETEQERVLDVTSANRFEMQNEVASVIANSKDFAGNFGMNYQPVERLTLSASASYATHNSKEESTLQAMTISKEVTEKALDRIVNKVKNERIVKIIEELEETNSHGFDNRKGDKHVVGVYRWVDKIYKNQIYNYGKRLMFEFMIPEPAKLHTLAMSKLVTENKAIVVQKPDDPRIDGGVFKIESFSNITEAKVGYWSSKFNVEIVEKPVGQITVGESFNIEANGGTKLGDVETKSGNGKIEIPEGYKATNAVGVFNAVSDNHSSGGRLLSLTIGNKTKKHIATFGSYSMILNTSSSNSGEVTSNENFNALQFGNEVPVSFTLGNHASGDISVSVTCVLTTEAENQWKKQTFKAIMDAYYEALEKYEATLKEKQEEGSQILGTNPGFYREIENIILRKNCISYLLDQNPSATRTYGKNFYYKNEEGASKPSLENMEIRLGSELDDYGSFVKFIEQAFEWDIMSYHFYPFYWGNRQNWVDKYQYDKTNDPIFKSFMQSGMARVIVTVRPGFEDAVRFYMQTGQIWNGGEVPVIEDELYLSIVDELRAPEGEKVGKAWWTRVPTSMTILQADSIGLKVEKALPFNEDLSDFEDPNTVPQSSEIQTNFAQIGGQLRGNSKLMGVINGNQGIRAKIKLMNIDGSIQDLTYSDLNGNWELNNLPSGRFELILDSEDKFSDAIYQVVEGSKQLVLDLGLDQTLEVNLTLTLL